MLIKSNGARNFKRMKRMGDKKMVAGMRVEPGRRERNLEQPYEGGKIEVN